MINSRLFLKNQQISSMLVCAIENQFIRCVNQASHKNKLSCTAVRTVTSAKPVAKKELKKPVERVDLLLLRLAGLRTALIVPTHVGASSRTLHTNAPVDNWIDQNSLVSSDCLEKTITV